MLRDVANQWWLMLLRGIAGIAFGVFAWVWPGKTLVMMLMFYAIYCLVEGISALVLGLSGRDGKRIWWQMLVVGLLGICASVFTVLWPKLTALVLLMVIACWAIVRGLFEIAAAIRLRKEIRGEWMEILSGVLSVLLGVLLIARPAVGLFAVVWMIGVIFMASGILHIILAFRLRQLKLPQIGEVRPAVGM